MLGWWTTWRDNITYPPPYTVSAPLAEEQGSHPGHRVLLSPTVELWKAKLLEQIFSLPQDLYHWNVSREDAVAFAPLVGLLRGWQQKEHMPCPGVAGAVRGEVPKPTSSGMVG